MPMVALPLGTTWSAGGLSLQVLGPRQLFHGTDSDPNNDSVVMMAQRAGIRILMTGDVETEAQQQLLNAGTDLAADVLKVPHHGSSKDLPSFLRAISPEVAVIGVGRDNDYGHPSPRTLDALRAVGTSAILRTDTEGDVAVSLVDGSLAVTIRGSMTTGSRCGARPRATICQSGRVSGPVEWVFLLGAGLVAGIIGTAGGITSLVAYPALLAVGLPPLTANVTNSVALLGSGFGAALRAGDDLTGHRATIRRWLPDHGAGLAGRRGAAGHHSGAGVRPDRRFPGRDRFDHPAAAAQDRSRGKPPGPGLRAPGWSVGAGWGSPSTTAISVPGRAC